MKKLQRLMGILLVAAAASGLVVACGNGDGTTCTSDDECNTGEVCTVDNECAFSCEADGDCLEEEFCDMDATEGTGGACAPDATGNNGVECTTNEECEDTEFCNDQGVCETTDVTTYQYAQITDVSDTTNDDLCGDSISDPGVDLFGVELTSADATESYWAATVNEQYTHDGELATSVGIIDGTAPGITDGCPDGTFSESVVALGCGGSLMVEFVDGSGQPVEILDGDTITVYEYGSQCNDLTVQDEWSLSICSDASDTNAGTCDAEISLESGEGLADVTVATEL